MNTIVAAFVDHPRMIITIACLVLVALIEVAVYRAGGNAVAAKMQAAQVAAQRKSDSAMAVAQAALISVKHENDSLHARNDSLRTRADSLAGVVATRRTSASLVNSRLALHGDTAQVATDSGVVSIPIPEVLTRQLAAMHMVNDSLVIAMDRRHEADSTLAHGLTAENDGLHVQIQLDSVVQLQYRKQLASVEAELAADEAKPKHSGAVAFLAGVSAALAGVVVLAVVH